LPGQVVAYSEKSGNIIRRAETAEQYTSWKEGVMNFDQSSLSEVAARIQQLYGITLIFPDDMLTQTFSADVVIANSDVSLLRRLLEASFMLTSEKKNDT